MFGADERIVVSEQATRPSGFLRLRSTLRLLFHGSSPAALRFHLTGKPSKWVSGKDLILHIIGMIGVDGERHRAHRLAWRG